MKASEFKANGYCNISNIGSIEIMLSQSGDGIIYRYFGKLAKRWQEIKYTNSGRPFFRVNKKAYYLDEFLKIR